MRGRLIQGMACAAAMVLAQVVSAQTCLDDRVIPVGPGTFGGDFGLSVAMSGETALVGAPSVIPAESGKAYVFSTIDSSWTQFQVLEPSDPEQSQKFGRASAVKDDTVVIVGTFKRHAYVFENAGLTWLEDQKLLPWDFPFGQAFGSTLAVSGNRLLTGAWQDTTNGNLAGSAYVFRHDGRQWVPEQKLYPSDIQPNHLFGHGVAIEGDTLAIGAPWDGDSNTPGCEGLPPSQCRAGAVYIFHFNARIGEWVEVQKIKPQQLDKVTLNMKDLHFGWDVALSGDTLLVGSEAAGIQNAPCGSTACGIAFIYTRDPETGLWGDVQVLLPEQPGIKRFGRSVSIDGDYAVIGTFDSNVGGNHHGAAYIYKRGHDNLWQPISLLLPEPSSQSNFGWSVAISGNHTLVGANFENGQQGAAYLHKVDAPGDIDCNGLVDGFDLLELLGAWGACPQPEFLHTEWMTCPADIAGAPPPIGSRATGNTGAAAAPDGVVDGLDLLMLLANWGPAQ